MPAFLQINGRDYSNYLKAQDEALDPYDQDMFNPQLSGLPALGEGQMSVGESVGAREWMLPLNISAGGPQALASLVSAMRNDTRDAGHSKVQFRPEGAATVSYFDLEDGRLDAKYKPMWHRKGWAPAELRLWTKPYAHGGTWRTVVPSQQIPGASGPVGFPITGIEGDGPALLNVYMLERMNGGGLTMFGAHALPSFTPWIGASTLTNEIGAASTFLSASVIGGVYKQFAQAPGGSSALFSLILPANAYCGRHRVFMLTSHLFQGSNVLGGSPACEFKLADITNSISGAPRVTQGTVIATTSFANVRLMQLVDLGELVVPSTSQDAQVRPDFRPWVTANNSFSGASPRFGSYTILVNGVILVPLDLGGGVVSGKSTNSQQGIGIRAWPKREALSLQQLGPSSAWSVGFGGDITNKLRGDIVRLPAGATQAVFMAWAFTATGGIENPAAATYAVRVDAVERWRYFRP